MEVYRIDINGNSIPNGLFPVGAVRIKNRCCPEELVIITKSKAGKEEWFSCQCNCGGWSTTGCKTIQEAISAWEKLK